MPYSHVEFKIILPLFSKIHFYSFGVQNGVHFSVLNSHTEEEAAELVPVQPRGVSSGFLVGWKIRAVFAARVEHRGTDKLAARVLPELAAVAPMESKLRQDHRDFQRLFGLKLNPNPFSNHFRQFPKARGFRLEQLQHAVSRQTAIAYAFCQVELRQLRFEFDKLCGSGSGF